MLKYILRCIAFGLLFIMINLGVLLLSCAPVFSEKIGELTNSSEYQDYWKHETMESIELLQGNPKADKAILGDSVMVSFLKNLRDENPNWCIANGNASFLLIGQYAMLNEYLDAHPDATEVYLVLRPPSLGEKLNGNFSYQFVIRPLVDGSHKEYLSTETVTEIQKKFTLLALSDTFEKMFGKSSLIRKLYLNLIREPSYHIDSGLSKEAAQYLKMMFDICSERNVELILLSAPMSDTSGNRNVEEKLKKDLQQANLLDKMPYYFDSLLYYSPDSFRDTVHFTDPEKYREEVFHHYQKVTQKMDDLFF